MKFSQNITFGNHNFSPEIFKKGKGDLFGKFSLYGLYDPVYKEKRLVPDQISKLIGKKHIFGSRFKSVRIGFGRNEDTKSGLYGLFLYLEKYGKFKTEQMGNFNPGDIIYFSISENQAETKIIKSSSYLPYKTEHKRVYIPREYQFKNWWILATSWFGGKYPYPNKENSLSIDFAIYSGLINNK